MDLTQVTLTQMRYALSILELGNFRAAAESVFVSQSALSMQLQKLEDLLGVTLFDRSKKPVLVTEEGRVALEQMRVIVTETERLAQVLSNDEEPAGPFRLGVIPSMSASLVPLFLGEFVQRFPKVELSIEEITTEESIRQLRRGQLDAVLCATPLRTPGFVEEVLAHEPLVAYLPPKHPLLKKKSVSQKDLAERPLWVMPEGHCFRTQVLSYCQHKSTTSPGGVHFESGNFETLIQLVDRGLGATILPALIAEGLQQKGQRGRLRPLMGPRPVREIALVSARKDLRKRIRDVLFETLKIPLDKALGSNGAPAEVLDPL